MLVFMIQNTSIKREREDTNTKYQAVNEGDIFPSVTKSRKIAIS